MNWQAIGALSAVFKKHPAFEAALLRHTEGILELRSRIRHTSKLFGKEERCRSFNIYGILAAEADQAGRKEVALADFLEGAHRADVSDRTAKTVASLISYYGFADQTVDVADRRRRVLVPKERTWTYMTDWAAPTFDALDLLGQTFEGDGRRAARDTFASAKEDYISASQAFFGGNAPFTRVFAYLEGGSLLCMSAVAAALRGQPALSLGEAAERFAISKAQLSRVVAEGRACGLFTSATKATPSEALIGQYAETIAVVLAFLSHHRDLGTRRWSAEADQAAAA